MKQFFSITIATILFLGLTTLPVQAQEASEILDNCVQINNGGDTCYQGDSVLINKKVLRPNLQLREGQELQDQNFIENTPLSEPYTSANNLTAFRLYVTNTTNNELKDITVVDIIPEKYLTYVTSDGVYNENSRTVTFKIDSLPGGETRAYTVQVMTGMGSLLPADPVCVTNQARASFTKDRFFLLPDETQKSQDNARLCITKNENGGTLISDQNGSGKTTTPAPSQRNGSSTTKGGLPIVSPTQAGQTPDTGAEALVLVGLLPAGAAGFFLRRRTK